MLCSLAGCSKLALASSKCDSCKVACYCSVDHQKQNSPGHHSVCSLLATSADCNSCALIRNKADTNEQTRSKKWVILHFTEDVLPLLAGDPKEAPPCLVIVFHKDDASEEFKTQNPKLFTRSHEDLNFLYFEDGKLVSSTSTPEWDPKKDPPKGFVNLSGADHSCIICDEDIPKAPHFFCRECGVSVCHRCCSNMIMAQEVTDVWEGHVSILCPTCRRQKWLRSERWGVSAASIASVKELGDLCELAESIKKAAASINKG